MWCKIGHTLDAFSYTEQEKRKKLYGVSKTRKRQEDIENTELNKIILKWTNWMRMKRIKQNIIIIINIFSTSQDPVMPNSVHPQAHVSLNICLIDVT